MSLDLNLGSIGLALAVLFILVAFWNALKSNSAAPLPLATPLVPELRPVARGGSEWEAIDLRQFLYGLPEAYEPTLAQLGIRLELEVPAMPLTVAIRKSDLQKLFAHIIRMVCEAPRREVQLRILARSDGRQAVVNCFDASCGEPQLARAFNAPERQAATSVLACRAIVGAYGGRIYKAPSPLGEGCLTVRLPLRRIGLGGVGLL